MKLLPVLLLLAFFGGGCVSAPNVPDWAGKNWQEKERLYFSGISSSCKHIACARQEAYNNALASMAAYLGTAVSVRTQSTVDNNGQFLTAVFTSSSQETALRQIQAEKFGISSYQGHLTGYILLSIEKRELERARAQLDLQALQKTQQRRQRQKIGPVAIRSPRAWKDLAGKLNNFLTKAGYCVASGGKTLYLQVEDFTCSKSHIQDVYSCTLQAKLTFAQRERVYLAKGFGRTRLQARQDAVDAWVAQIPQEVLEK